VEPTHFLYLFGTGTLCRPNVEAIGPATPFPSEVTCGVCLALMGRQPSAPAVDAAKPVASSRMPKRLGG
jgi:hypothetical protein